jgi:hypothetical protein
VLYRGQWNWTDDVRVLVRMTQIFCKFRQCNKIKTN